MRRKHAPGKPCVIVLDDVHLLRHPDILVFLERGLTEEVKNTSIILICRELPDINLTGLSTRGLVSEITEEELKFTESELDVYLRSQGVNQAKHVLKKILADTDGWAFLINLLARSLKKSPGYLGYTRTAMRHSIFKLMETEVFSACSERLKRFFVKLSLIDHLSADLVEKLAAGESGIMDEMRRKNAYIQFDGSVNAYNIHNLFLDFLREKQGILTEIEVRRTYKQAAEWCGGNGFEAEALTYLEKIKDYEGITAILRGLPAQMPMDLALHASGILERVPEDIIEKVYFLAVMRVRILLRIGRMDESAALMRDYTERFKRLPPGPFRDITLGAIYYNWANLRALMCVTDHVYDFDLYYAKTDEYVSPHRVKPDQYSRLPVGFWASLCGSERRGAPEDYINAAERTVKHVAHSLEGSTAGIDVLCRGELLFYQGNIKAAEPVIIEALSLSRENGQFETEHKALFYLLRISCWQGNYEKSAKILNVMGSRLEEETYAHRFLNHDVALGWLHLSLRRPELVPSWLKERFSPYSHAYFVENMGNQIKARYAYQCRNYPPLLAYIGALKRRESVLYGRVEMFALEACVRWQMKERGEAFDALRAAYEQASPNGLLAPFAELGKDMRSLSSSAIRAKAKNLPAEWLETVRRLSASYAKHQSLMISHYESAVGERRPLPLSEREREILRDLYNGLSRTEIAVKKSVSVNTVNSAVNNIFNKLGARGTIDAVRIASEEKLL